MFLVYDFFSFPMQTQDFTQRWLSNKQRFHYFPKQHISLVFLLILTCRINFENGLEGQIFLVVKLIPEKCQSFEKLYFYGNWQGKCAIDKFSVVCMDGKILPENTKNVRPLKSLGKAFFTLFIKYYLRYN